jgi:uncharacterized glyoxalase superfamily metalloenzyme YdcJ
VPSTETALLEAGLGYFRFTATPRTELTSVPHYSVTELVRSGALQATPIVYEDFLPRSAAGIFSSNLTGIGTIDVEQSGLIRDAGWLAEALEAPVRSGEALYEQQSRDSLTAAVRDLGLDPARIPELTAAPLHDLLS